MRKDLTELVFILDRSGSMRGLEADTIGGFNSLIEKQKKEVSEMSRPKNMIYKSRLKSDMTVSIVIGFAGVLILALALIGASRNSQMGSRTVSTLISVGTTMVTFPLTRLGYIKQFKQFFKETGLEEASIEEFRKWKETGKVTGS